MPSLDDILALPWSLAKRETREGALCVKRTRTRMVLRLDPAGPEWGGAAGGAVFVKRYLNPYLRRRLGSLMGVSKARAESRAVDRVQRLGLQTPEVLGHWTAWSASYLATREMAPLSPLGEALARLEGAARAHLWRLAGKYSLLMAERGVSHPDFFQDHLCLLVPPEEAASLDAVGPGLAEAFALLDLDGVKLGRPSARERAWSAAQMLKSLAPELGGPEERMAYVRASFGGELDAPLAMILRLARAKGLETGLPEASRSTVAGSR